MATTGSEYKKHACGILHAISNHWEMVGVTGVFS